MLVPFSTNVTEGVADINDPGKLAEGMMPTTADPNPNKRLVQTAMRTEWGKQMYKQTVVQGWYNFMFNGGKTMVPALN